MVGRSKKTTKHRASLSSTAHQQSDSDTTSNNEEYRVKRFLNNEAVRRSRQKTREQDKETVERVELLRKENTELEQRVEVLSKELQFLKDMFIAYASGGSSDTKNKRDKKPDSAVATSSLPNANGGQVPTMVASGSALDHGKNSNYNNSCNLPIASSGQIASSLQYILENFDSNNFPVSPAPVVDPHSGCPLPPPSQSTPGCPNVNFNSSRRGAHSGKKGPQRHCKRL